MKIHAAEVFLVTLLQENQDEIYHSLENALSITKDVTEKVCKKTVS